MALNISYVTSYDALDVHNWSGLGYHIAKSLEGANAKLDYIKAQASAGPLLKIKSRLYTLAGKKYLQDRNARLARQMAGSAAPRIDSNADIIFSPGTIPIAFLDAKQPKVFYTDAPFSAMVDFYDGFKNLTEESLRDGHGLEKSALESCSLALYSSDWAAESAIQNYQIDHSKVRVVPFGANITCNRTLDDIKAIVDKRSMDECSLLFMGIDWERKGGTIALETARLLHESGLKVKLHIVGPKVSPLETWPSYVEFHGFLSKARPEDVKEIERLFSESHFFIMPTKAEAYGLVFCEANSFGLPNIAPRIGGITTIVRDGVNGQLFDPHAAASVYAEYISHMFSDQRRYRELALSSFNEYQQRLNWDVAGKSIMRLLKDL